MSEALVTLKTSPELEEGRLTMAIGLCFLVLCCNSDSSSTSFSRPLPPQLCLCY
ncbi:hypothetical protein YC2023_107729 [Brassica napus]